MFYLTINECHTKVVKIAEKGTVFDIQGLQLIARIYRISVIKVRVRIWEGVPSRSYNWEYSYGCF